MTMYLERNIEPSFAAEAEWYPRNPNLRIPVRHITWHHELENNDLKAHIASREARPIIEVPTVTHSTPRTSGIRTGHLPQIGDLTNIHPGFDSLVIVPTARLETVTLPTLEVADNDLISGSRIGGRTHVFCNASTYSIVRQNRRTYQH